MENQYNIRTSGLGQGRQTPSLRTTENEVITIIDDGLESSTNTQQQFPFDESNSEFSKHLLEKLFEEEDCKKKEDSKHNLLTNKSQIDKYSNPGPSGPSWCFDKNPPVTTTTNTAAFSSDIQFPGPSTSSSQSMLPKDFSTPSMVSSNAMPATGSNTPNTACMMPDLFEISSLSTSGEHEQTSGQNIPETSLEHESFKPKPTFQQNTTDNRYQSPGINTEYVSRVMNEFDKLQNMLNNALNVITNANLNLTRKTQDESNDARLVLNEGQLNSYLNNRIVYKRIWSHYSPSFRILKTKLAGACSEFEMSLNYFLRENEDVPYQTTRNGNTVFAQSVPSMDHGVGLHQNENNLEGVSHSGSSIQRSGQNESKDLPPPLYPLEGFSTAFQGTRIPGSSTKVASVKTENNSPPEECRKKKPNENCQVVPKKRRRLSTRDSETESTDTLKCIRNATVDRPPSAMGNMDRSIFPAPYPPVVHNNPNSTSTMNESGQNINMEGNQYIFQQRCAGFQPQAREQAHMSSGMHDQQRPGTAYYSTGNFLHTSGGHYGPFAYPNIPPGVNNRFGYRAPNHSETLSQNPRQMFVSNQMPPPYHTPPYHYCPNPPDV